MGKRLFTKRELLRKLVEFSKKVNKSRISKTDLDKDKAFPSSATYKRYFGSWSNALKLAKLKSGIITGRPQDKEIIIPDKALDIINGELLGDGSMPLGGEYKSNAYFEHSTANIDYGKYLYNKLKNYVPLLNSSYCPKRNKRCNIQFRTRSRVNIAWTKIRNKWYINGKKIIPNDLILTKEVCLHWYLGDGYSEDKTCKFSTCGFTKKENEKLCELLLNIGFKSNINKRSGGYYIIRMRRSSSFKFLDWLGPCPAKGYEHRWNIGEKSKLLTKKDLETAFKKFNKSVTRKEFDADKDVPSSITAIRLFGSWNKAKEFYYENK